jgi:uncharacterized protein (TIGR03437 family)
VKGLNRFAAVVLLATSAAFAQISNIVVTSAASFEAGMPAPGSIAAVFCTGLQVEGIVVAETLPLPFELAGVKVWVGGAPAPLFAVAEGQGFQQINIQVPQEAEFQTDNTTEVLIEQGGQRGTGTATLRASTPGDFFRWPGTNLGIFQHWPDYSLVTEDNPARPGEILITYLTGMPETNPVVPTGEPSPSDPLATVRQYSSAAFVDTLSLEFSSGGVMGPTTRVTWAGLTPGLVGVYQANFAVPVTVEPGDKAVTLWRHTCKGIFGSCGGGTHLYYFSSPVLLPVR